MQRRSCPQCQKRLPYAARRCTLCGWSHGADPDPRVSRTVGRRRGLAWFAALLVIGMGGAVATQNAEALADWYASFAAYHLPEQMSSYAVADTERGAFFYCARQVVREMDGEFSIETFPSLAESSSEVLGDGRYRIASWVEEARLDGERIRHAFTCTAQYLSGRWSLEDLRFEEPADG